MSFETITINGFRGIKKLELTDLSNVNLFIGKNNASKTSILEAIYVLTGAYNPNVLLFITNFRSVALDEPNDLRFIFYNLDYKNELIIEGTKKNEYKRSVKVTPAIHKMKVDQKNPNPIANNAVQNQFNATISKDVFNELVINLTIKERHQKVNTYRGSLYHVQGLTFNAELPSNFAPDILVNYIPISMFLSFDISQILNDLIINKQKDELIDGLKKIDGNIKDISIGRKNMVYAEIEGMQQLIPLYLNGDGIRKIFFLLLAIRASKDGVLIIDEIENGLHFSTLKTLWKVLLTTAKKYNVQIFATTHNYETIKYLKESLESDEGKEYQDFVRTYTIKKLENLEHKAYCYKFPEFENAIDQGIEIR